MTCVQEQDFTPASGLCGRAFQLTAGDAEFSVFFALPEANASFLSTAPYVILPYAAMLALVHGEDLNCGGMTADSVLLRNMRCALEEVVRAHSGFRVPQIVNLTEAPVVANTSGQTGVFFLEESTVSFLYSGTGKAATPTVPSGSVPRRTQFISTTRQSPLASRHSRPSPRWQAPSMHLA